MACVKRKVIISINNENKKVIYFFNSKTKVREFLQYLVKYTELSDYQINDNELIGCFDFIDINGEKQKAKLDFSLESFLKNFNYDPENIKMHFDCAFGIGNSFEFDEIAKIQINSNEPTHQNPHVHIYKIKKYYSYCRIDLKTFSQLKTDSLKFDDLFSKKERKKILDFLKENQEKLIDYYNHCTKGEYITENYILEYRGKEYVIKTMRAY